MNNLKRKTFYITYNNLLYNKKKRFHHSDTIYILFCDKKKTQNVSFHSILSKKIHICMIFYIEKRKKKNQAQKNTISVYFQTNVCIIHFARYTHANIMIME